MAGGLAATTALRAQAATDGGFTWGGRLVQGGFMIARGPPRAEVVVNGKPVGQASSGGWFVVGFDRDEPQTAVVGARVGAVEADRRFDIARGVFDIQRIDGLPQDQVAPTGPALLERIARESRQKQAAFASVADTEDFRDGFSMPFQPTRRSSSFGGQRILNGEPKRPH